jgi:hypothetical protein
MGNCCKKGSKAANPAAYAPVRTQAKEVVPQFDMEARKAMAASKIQRSSRRQKALKVAKAEQQWKMFADLDTQDEAEMLHLAVFMQTLLDFVPGVDKFEGSDLKEIGSDSKEEEEDKDGEFIISLDSIALNEKVSRKESQVMDVNDYDISESNFDTSTAMEIVDLFRKGGKLSRKSVVKILRRAYKSFQKQPNTTHLTVGNGCKLTVVGDLHGQLTDLLHILDESGPPSATNKFIFNGMFYLFLFCFQLIVIF